MPLTYILNMLQILNIFRSIWEGFEEGMLH